MSDFMEMADKLRRYLTTEERVELGRRRVIHSDCQRTVRAIVADFKQMKECLRRVEMGILALDADSRVAIELIDAELNPKAQASTVKSMLAPDRIHDGEDRFVAHETLEVRA